MSRRTYADYSTFSAGEDIWFLGDQDDRIRLGGIVWGGSLRGDILTLGGSRGLGRSAPRTRAVPTIPPRNPRAQLPPR